MNYTSREVVRRLKQYDMFLNSLNLTNDEIQRERICDQLDKIEKQILLDTNSEYEEEYLLLLSKQSRFIEEEKTRLRDIISLITSRREYLNKRKNEHKKITGSLVELTTFLGEDKLSSFKRRLEIIEKYEENKVRQEELIRDMKVLDVKISEASRNVKANARLNESLEKKLISLVGLSLEKQGLYKLVDKKDEILRKHSEYKSAYVLAKDNLKTANELGDSDYILECNTMLTDISSLYLKYTADVNIINLINIYDNKVSDYEELLEKRQNIDVILKNIVGTELYKDISDELNKQFNTIKLEGNDIKIYEKLKETRDKKNKELYEIDEENNSKEFKDVLEELVKNENRQKEERIKKARREEQAERQKKIAEEQKIEAARVRRQKLIEEARLKEQSEVAEKMKKLQEKTVIKETKPLESPSIYENIIPKEEPKSDIDEPIKNPLKDKTLEDYLKAGEDFDTDELFENTRITPNKPLKDSLFKDSVKSFEEEVPMWEPPLENIKEEEHEPLPEVSLDLFKEEPSVVKAEVPEVKEEIKEPIVEEKKEEKKPSSIYDLLENNENIIWKTTNTAAPSKDIPVIGNNKLKPEIINDNNMSFPDLKKKEGELLWKETL